MASAIKELLGKEAHELTDEELADLIRGNRPKAIESKNSSSAKPRRKILVGDTDDDDDIEDENGLPFSLDDSEER